MGSQVRASCPCGYDKVFTVGGSMSSYRTHSYFPYRCRSCGIVSVNIAEDPVRCSKNASHHIERIGGSFAARMAKKKVDEERRKPRRRTFLEWLGLTAAPAQVVSEIPPEPWVRCQWGDHEIYDEPYECPKCGANSLTFASTGLSFD